MAIVRLLAQMDGHRDYELKSYSNGNGAEPVEVPLYATALIEVRKIKLIKR